MTLAGPRSSVVIVPASPQGVMPAELEQALEVVRAVGHPVWITNQSQFSAAILDRMLADALEQGFREVIVFDTAIRFSRADFELLRSDHRPLVALVTDNGQSQPERQTHKIDIADAALIRIRREVLESLVSQGVSKIRFFANEPDDLPGRKGANAAFQRRANSAGFPVAFRSKRPPMQNLNQSLSILGREDWGAIDRSFLIHRPAILAAFDLLDGFLDVLECIINFQAAPARTVSTGTSKCHTSGDFQRTLASGPGILPWALRAWIEDLEHGLFHGLSAAFLASVWAQAGRPTYRRDLEPLVASCIVHDFLRPSGVHARHDARLAEWFPDLNPAVYSHSNPLPESSDHPLVVGDRLELARYPDHASWVDTKVLGQYTAAEPVGPAIRAYLQFVRPALEAVFRGRNDVWLRHGEEPDVVLSNADAQGDDLIGVVETVFDAFPRRYWAPRPGYWCVEVGSAPFEGNIVRDWRTYSPLVVLSLTDYRRYSTHPLIPIRDHQAAAGLIPYEAWVCLLGPDDLSRDAVSSLLARSRGIVRLDQANRLLKAARQIGDILTVLRSDASSRPLSSPNDAPHLV